LLEIFGEFYGKTAKVTIIEDGYTYNPITYDAGRSSGKISFRPTSKTIGESFTFMYNGGGSNVRLSALMFYFICNSDDSVEVETYEFQIAPSE